MTTVTTVLGLFPLALGIGEGSEFLQPLGIVVFSGMSLATLLTLFIIPCFYIMLHDINWNWVSRLLKSMPSMGGKLFNSTSFQDKKNKRW
jgi:predicted RND superfamily exporter protein